MPKKSKRLVSKSFDDHSDWIAKEKENYELSRWGATFEDEIQRLKDRKELVNKTVSNGSKARKRMKQLGQRVLDRAEKRQAYKEFNRTQPKSTRFFQPQGGEFCQGILPSR